MSILNAIKQQGSSIDDLSKLPQAMIMTMAQKNQIPAEMVAPILARKAEMADAVARTKTLQSAGAPAPSVMEQLMQKNAEEEQPEPQAREMGIASNPIPERNYAGGGIVAFANNQDQPVSENMPRDGETESDYMRRVRANEESVKSGLSELFNARNWDPLQSSYRAVKQGVMDPWNRFIKQSPESQAVDFNAASEARRGDRPMFANRPEDTARDTAAKTEVAKIIAEQKAVNQAKPISAKQAEIQDLESSSNKSPTAKKVLTANSNANAPSKLKTVTGAPEMQGSEPKVDPIDAMLARYEKMLNGDPEAAAKAKKEAMWSRLAEAGLGIMGGTSTNFAENVGKGATQAMRGYADDVKGLRSEEAAKLQQLMGLGLKGAALKQEALKLGITEKHFEQMYKAQMAQIGEMGASRRDTAALRADTATDNRVLNAAKMLAARPENQSLSDEELYNKATKLVTGQGTQPTFPGFSGRPLK